VFPTPYGRALAVALAMAGCDKLRALPGFEPAPAMSQSGPPPVAMGPWLLEPATGRVTVAWTTQTPSLGRVWYGTREPDRLASETGEPVLEHRVTLGALQPATRYRYRVEGGADTAWFESAPAPGGEGPIEVVVYGDNRGNNGDHALLARAAASERAQLLLHTGGMVTAPREDRLWRAWFQEEIDLLAHAPIVAARSDDPDDGGAFARYFQRRGMPAYGSLDYGPVHICVLDSSEAGAAEQGGISDAQRAWFEEDLRGVPSGRHVWVLVHHGPLAHSSQKRPGPGGSESVQAALQAAARVHPIGAVFGGHAHYYERGAIANIPSFVLGAGGAPLEEPDRSAAGVQAAASALSYAAVAVCGCHATGVVKDIAGRVLDSFKLADCPTPCGKVEAQPVAAAAPAPQAPAAAVEPADAGSPTDRGSRRHSRRRRKSPGGLDGGAAPAENRRR
jgi:hypothetical protein